MPATEWLPQQRTLCVYDGMVRLPLSSYTQQCQSCQYLCSQYQLSHYLSTKGHLATLPSSCHSLCPARGFRTELESGLPSLLGEHLAASFPVQWLGTLSSLAYLHQPVLPTPAFPMLPHAAREPRSHSGQATNGSQCLLI